MRAVIYQHEEHEGPGRFGPALRQVGFELVPRFRSARHADVEAELLVVMGGSMAVYGADAHPFLRDERSVISERLAQGRPCLGVCLGAQLMASAAGAEVLPGKNGFEVGVAPVRWTEAALKDGIFAGVRPKTTVAHWHGDTYAAVPDAVLLASTDRYTQQAFRLGDSLAFQFHVELTAEELGRWLDGAIDELPLMDIDPAAVRRTLPRLAAAEPELQMLTERIAHHFARVSREATQR